MRLLNLAVVLISVFPQISNSAFCYWPTVDVLFVLDSTANMGPTNHELMKRFVAKIVENINVEKSDSRVAVAQFTPKPRVEISLANGLTRATVLLEDIMNIPYEPCSSKDDKEKCQPIASLNSLTQSGLEATEGNRQWVADMVIVISTALYSIPELNENEVLLHPISPIHAFFVSVGGSASLNGDLQSSATNVRLSAVDFAALDDLVEPLCESANDFVGNSRESNSTFLGGSTCLIVIITMAVVFIVILLMLAYCVYAYRREYTETKYRLQKREQDIKRQYEYYRGKLDAERTRGSEVNKTDPGLTGSNPIVQHHHHHHEQSNLSQLNRNLDNQGQESKNSPEKRTKKRKKGTKTPRANNPNSVESNEDGSGSEFSYEDSSDGEISEEDSMQRTMSNLPDGHPARTLPPIDLLFLVDSSSSIGITNFESVKNFLITFVDNVDIAPGRSRVAAIIFDKEPTVCFSFDRFYSHNTVKKALTSLPYRGGPTFLAKALNFAAGILWQEQNMRTGKHRKHKLMPTPRHDRLQIMLVVSDGYSEDNVEKAATQMHDRLRVKIAAVVTKSFNRERMVPVTRFEGSVFVPDQKETLSLWMWRQQKLWNENYGDYIKREKSLPLSTART
ncbi:hypothetical protein L596_012926 [Steinernema carpocapsae]|uniref:VWFA domain-containing protein n=1 Tax=Steinernema carpocapsae TaxID=34508 RepID=A0A4U5NYQ0_STECR|nr:hypothetical protein L596_012926 [Steinernema carpocapsae]